MITLPLQQIKKTCFRKVYTDGLKHWNRLLWQRVSLLIQRTFWKACAHLIWADYRDSGCHGASNQIVIIARRNSNLPQDAKVCSYSPCCWKLKHTHVFSLSWKTFSFTIEIAFPPLSKQLGVTRTGSIASRIRPKLKTHPLVFSVGFFVFVFSDDRMNVLRNFWEVKQEYCSSMYAWETCILMIFCCLRFHKHR